MSIQGSINQIIGSVAGAAGTVAVPRHRAAAQQSLREHEMQMLQVKLAAKEKISRRNASIERLRLKAQKERQLKKEYDESPIGQLQTMGVNLNNPTILASLERQGIDLGGINNGKQRKTSKP